MTKGKIMPILLRFTIPLMIGNMFQQLYNMVDTIIVGRFVGAGALAAVGSTGTIMFLTTGFAQGVSSGFSVVVSQKYGAKDLDGVKASVANGILLSIISSILMTVFCLVIMHPLLVLMNTPADIFDNAYTYIMVISIGISANVFYNLFSAYLRAVGNSQIPLFFLIFSACLNVVLDLLLIVTFRMGVAGAAWATVLSQSVSAIISLLYMFKRYPFFRFTISDFKLTKTEIKDLYASGLSMAAMMSLVFFGTLALQCAINTFGQDIIVAHTAARKITEFFMLPFSVMGVTMATYCGQNMGAGRKDRIRTGICQALILTWIWSLGMILLSYTVAPWLIWLVTGSKNPAVLSNATWYLKTDTLFYFAPAAISILRNGLQGMGDHITPVFSSMIELIGKVICAFLLARIFQYWGIIMAEPIVWILMVIPLIIKARKLL